MNNLAKKLINDHRNPIVKVDATGSKLFLKSSAQEDDAIIQKHQTNLESILNYERAERRCARSQATWSPEDKLAKVTKMVKTLSNFGYQDKNGTFLYPEEALFLIETNRLELMFNGVPLSIQESYDLLLKSCECDTVKYKVFKKLALLGYKLLRNSELSRRSSRTVKKQDFQTNDSTNEVKTNESLRRQTSEEYDEVEFKKRKLNPDAERYISVTDNKKINVPGGSKRNGKQREMEHIEQIFKNLQETTPREDSKSVTDDESPDYCVFLPNNKSRCDYDFKLYVCTESILKRHHNKSSRSLYAVCAEGNISFYKFGPIQLPFQ